MIGAMSPIWPEAARVFHERAPEYDGWFDDSLVFDIELAALKDLTTPLGVPRLEVGVGPGRFAAELGMSFGIDPAFGALVLAQKRLAGICQGVGEMLPMRSGSVATVYLLFTLCFTEKPATVMCEIGRILKPGGHLVLGVVPRESPWGKSLRQKKREGHPFYQHSRFYGVEQICTWLTGPGLNVVEERSALFQPPGKVVCLETSRQGVDDAAGFVLLVARKSQDVDSSDSSVGSV
jgi:ubiquinone/menaquinone biosynthesis C-methylase UbiE